MSRVVFDAGYGGREIEHDRATRNRIARGRRVLKRTYPEIDAAREMREKGRLLRARQDSRLGGQREELLDHMGDGLYIHSLAYGFGFGFRIEAQVRLAEEVRAGRRTGRYFSGGLIDEKRTALTRAVELGNESIYNRNGMCGKEGQLLYDVGTRSPAIRMETLRVRP